MSNNAILAWANHVDTESWGRYLAQHYAKAPAAQVFDNYPRDPAKGFRWMTAADLGLPRHHEVWTSQPMMDFAKAQHELRQADAPYSFWLGAQG